MKKFLILISVMLCLLCGTLAFAACGESANTGNTGSGGNQTEQPGDGQTPDDKEDFTVTYDANGGTFGQSTLLTQTVKKNAALTAPASPTRSNYTFAGWAKDKSGSEMWNFSDNKVSEDTTLFAVWKQKSATIFSVDGASIDKDNIFMTVSPDTDFVRLSDKVVCSEDSSWQLFYDAWGSVEISTKIATGKDGALSNGNNTFFIVVTSQDKTQSNTYALVIHRQYNVQIRYLANDSLYETKSILTGTELTQDYDIPCSVKGYTFHGWNHSENFGDTIWDNVTFTASLTANQYTLYYDPNGAVGSVQEQTVKMDASLEISHDPLFTRQYFTLKEYNTQPDGEGTSVHLGSSLKFDFGEDTTLYAIWECDYTFTVSAEGVTITGYQHPLKVIDLSENLDGEPIIAISASAFRNNMTANEIILPGSVTKIGRGAFYGCTKLESLTLPFVGTERNGEKDNYFAILFTSSASDEATIPQSLHTVNITDATSIGREAFLGCKNIRTINLPMGLQEIGDAAFAFSGITSIKIPDSVTKIGGGAFTGCESLADVTLNQSIAALSSCEHEGADNETYTWGFFENCTALQHISIPNGVGEIGIRAFANSGLTQINIPESVTSIEANAFADCSALESVTFDANSRLSSIGESAFYNCNGLTQITIPQITKKIGEGCFIGCTGLESLTLPFIGTERNGEDNDFAILFTSSASDEVTIPQTLHTVKITDAISIGKEAFMECENIRTITLPMGLQEIGDMAFASSGITSINIPESVTKIGGGVFFGCESLADVTFGHITALPAYTVENADNGTDTWGFFENCTALQHISIPNGVGEIGIRAFAFSGLVEIDIPESVTTIDVGAFAGCSALENVTFDTNSCLSSIGALTFDSCSSLTEIQLPNKLLNIGDAAFAASGITSINIPESVITIGGGVFIGCESLADVTLGHITALLAYTVENTDNGTDTWGFFDSCAALQHISIPNGVGEIGIRAFAYTGLTEITIPESVTIIDAGAFAGCSALENVTFDTNSRLSSIGESAFYNCSGLTQINIPESVTTIETAAFFGCSALENVTFDTNSRLSSIGAAVFYNCSGLTQITIPESVISIGDNAFWDCDMLQSIVWNAENCLQAGSIADSTVYSIFGGRTNIKTVTFGEKVKMIPSYALGWCSGLISVVIPDSVTWIGPQAFCQCTGLTSVTIGSGVTSIGVGAFYGCNCLQSVTFRDLNGWSCGGVKVDTTILQNSTAAAEYVMANSGLYWTKETLN